MKQKKKFFLFAIPAICIYAAIIGCVTVSTILNRTNSQKETVKKATENVSKNSATSSSQLEVISESLLENLRESNTTPEASAESSIGFASAINADTPALIEQKNTEETANAQQDTPLLSDDGQPLNGMGGADVNPQPEMGIELPELYYTVYRIKEGDIISKLAENFGVTQDSIISVNNIKQSRSIQIGQYICIPSIPGIVYTTKDATETPESIAEKYKVSAAKVAFVNNSAENTTFASGATVFVPDAELDWVTRQEINGDLFTRPIHRGYYISSSYSWRVNPFTQKRTFHNGIDLACAKGTPVYAALGGVVVAAGWDNVYGNYITISHHSGYKTLYGHLSKIIAKKGQYVSTSTKIGEVGSTGQSTGPHLHFTVYKNGRTINPTQLWN